MALTAIRGRLVTCVDDPAQAAGALVTHADGLIVIRDGRIEAVGDAAALLPALEPGTPVDHHPDCVVSPGFIDTHVHYAQSAIIAAHGAHRAGERGAQLLDWLERYAFPEELRFADAAYASAMAARFCDTLLRHGTTSALVFCAVFPQSVDALFEAARRRGMRLIAGKVLMDRNAPRELRDTAQRGYDESKALIARWHGRGRLGYAITPRFAVTSTPAQLEAAGALWREHPDCWVQSHVSENADEIAWVKRLFPRDRDYVGVYGRYGLLGRRAIYGHGLHLAGREWRELASSGTALAHCPTSNLFLGSGLFRWDRATKPGRRVEVGLATDVGGGTTLSFLRTMGEAYKVAHLAGTSMPAAHAFWLATQGGARALDLDGKVGNLAPGHDADLVVLDLASTPLIAQRLRHAADIDEALFVQMTLGDDRAVLETWIAGRKVYERDAAAGPPP